MNCPHCEFDIPDAPYGYTVGTSHAVDICPNCSGAVCLWHECQPDIEWVDENGVWDSAPGCFEYYEARWVAKQ